MSLQGSSQLVQSWSLHQQQMGG